MVVTPQPTKRKLDQQLSPAQIPRRPKIEHEQEIEQETATEDENENELGNENESPDEIPAEPVLATTYLPTEIMDSQDEEEEEWLDSPATDVTKPDPEPGHDNLGDGEDETELLLRSMVEGDV